MLSSEIGGQILFIFCARMASSQNKALSESLLGESTFNCRTGPYVTLSCAQLPELLCFDFIVYIRNITAIKLPETESLTILMQS